MSRTTRQPRRAAVRAATFAARLAATVVAVVAVVAVFAALSGTTAWAATGATSPSDTAATAAQASLVPASGPYFGPILDYTADSAAAYSRRLGAIPAVYGQSVRYPLAATDRTYLSEFVQQAAGQGSLALLTVEPTVALSSLTTADATALAAQLADLHNRYATKFYVRFAPEMNGSWKIWGQQPTAYVQAFRTVAAALHTRLKSAAVMVWEPSYGAGYPFGAALGKVPGSGPRPADQLDTNHDGRVTEADDPYAPYWPGSDAVDWVGLTIYDYGSGRAFGGNVEPSATQYADELAGTFGYGSVAGAGRDFVGRYAIADRKPMMVETGALYDPAQPGGATEQSIKQSWWQQVFAPRLQQRYPEIKLLAWLEKQRPEAEAKNALIDWRATHTAALASALAADLRAGGLSLGPVFPIQDANAANSATAQSAGASHGDQLSWIVWSAVTLAVLFLLSGLVMRFVPSWRYPDEGKPRDRRLDLFRGWIIVAVVVTHIEVAGPYSYLTLNAIGAITGAEMFVLLSGVVLGMVYPIAVRRLGALPAVTGMVRRAGRLYVTALGVVLFVFVLSKVPFIHAGVITTFTDRGTGSGGANAAGRVYDLYPNADRLLDYPPPWYAVRDLLLLRIGPWPFNIMGLFVILTLLVPPLVWLLSKRLWWVVLAVSWLVYIVDANRDVHLFHAQFEDVFPLLTWQIAFTHGLVIGYYRRQIVTALTTLWGKLLVGLLVVGYSGFLALLWFSRHLHFRVPLLPETLYDDLYLHWYVRIYLQPGRLIDLALMLVVAYTVLTAFWKPVHAAFGWFYEPLGENSLYVFIVHVFFVLAVGNIGALDRGSAWQGFIVHTVVLAAIWLMVKKRFLFRVIPS